jgi:tetratricopeptide (TPR) repeat protein
MHTAITATPVLRGRKEPVDALLVHAGQLLLGGPSASVVAYRIPVKTAEDRDGSSSSTSLRPAEAGEAAWGIKLTRSVKAVEQLKVIREANLLVSLIDASVALHDIATIQETSASTKGQDGSKSRVASSSVLSADATTTLAQTKGAISIALDTSIQRSPRSPDQLAAMGEGAGYRFRAGANTVGRAYRPSDATQGRRGGNLRMSLSPSTSTMRNANRPMSLLAMEDIKRDKEEKRRFMTMHPGSSAMRSHDISTEDDVMCVVTTLCVGCRRKVIIFRWIDGAFWDTKELHLPHTPRTLAFPTPSTLFMGYTAAEYAILTVPLACESSVADLLDVDRTAARNTIPSTSLSGPRVDLYDWKLKGLDIPLPGAMVEPSHDGGSASSVHQSQQGGTQVATGGMTAMAGAALTGLSGLSGYMGMASKNKPMVVQIEGGEVLVCRESLGVFLSEDGKPTRRDGIEWRAVPEEVAYVKPYVLSIVPPIVRQTPAYPTLQISSASTLAVVQSLPFPPSEDTNTTGAGNYPSVRLLTASTGNKPPVFVKVTPTERGALERDGLTIWSLEMKSWGRQIDDLVQSGEYQEALALLHSVDEVLLDDKEERKAHIEALYAVSLFSQGKYGEAIDHFLELDTNPARVIALYPSYISGPLARDRSLWLEMFGAKKLQPNTNVVPDSAKTMASAADDNASIMSGRSTARNVPRDRSILNFWGRRPHSMIGGDNEELGTSPVPSMSKGSPAKAGASTTSQPEHKDQGTSFSQSQQQPQSSVAANADATVAELPAIPATTALPQPTEDERQAIDALGSFLADRRRIYKPILEQQPSSHSIAMSQVKRDPTWLLALPSKALGALEMDQLLAIAQTVDTALFKTFLATKPGLIGSLCRLENWCEVTQVEELLMQRQKFSELIALYGGKEMHDKALALLRKMSEEEGDMKTKVEPTVRYLQNLDASHIELILTTSHWVWALDHDSALEIFTADTGKVSSFPRYTIVSDLERFDDAFCTRYLDHLVYNLGEGDPGLHEKLATLLLRQAERSKGEDGVAMGKLTDLLEFSRQYRAERILNRVPTDETAFYDIRALLLGRLGQDEAALRIYVDKLGDHGKAEEYCKRIANEQPDSSVFLTLLRIYLRPKKKTSGKEVSQSLDSIQLEPALKIISRYGAQLNAKAAMELLPLHVPLSSVDLFTSKALCQTSAKQAETKIISEIAKERSLQVAQSMTALHRRRVRITEGRTCPRCMKRLGNSVVAVTTKGAVLHYGCSSLSSGDESSRGSPRR